MLDKMKKELLDKIEGTDELCNYCSWTRGGNINTCMGMCEGRWCKEASETYLDEYIEVEDKNVRTK